MPKNQEIVMETTHGRKPKCKTEFKAVINKVLVSGLILTTLMTSTIMPAYAATNISVLNNDGIKITQSYGVSIEQSIYEIKATISAINEMKANGTVSDAMIQKLASQIYALGQAVNYSSEVNMDEVSSILDKAETVVNNLDNAEDVTLAITVTRAVLGLNDSYNVTPYQAQNIGNLVGFNDVDAKKHSWAIEAIQDMSVGTYKGLFKGTTATDANGYASFSPDNPMTRAEFITVVTRALYSGQLAELPPSDSSDWYRNNYDIALEYGLITEGEYAYSPEVLNQAIPRQEMALIIMRACEQKGESTSAINVERIADYNSIGEYYQYAVRVAFKKGIIAGVDSKGTFAPTQTLTRAQGATVLYRLVNESKRQDSTPFDNASGTSENITAPITIYEGQYRNNRNAKEGDTFVKADGTKIVLKKGPNGILGEGQGVAPDVGLNLGLYTVKSEGGRFGYNPDVYGNMFDSTGHNIQNENYYINRTTGEGYWTHEMHVLAEVYSKPTYDGTQGEVSKDNFWVYDFGEWVYNFSH